MRKVTLPVVSDSLIGELRALVRLYRGGSVFREDGAPPENEAAVILGAQVLSGGRPSGTLRARVWHAARLYADGEVGLVIPTGGVGEHPPSEAEVAAGMLRGAGVPEEAILLEGKAQNTRESASGGDNQETGNTQRGCRYRPFTLRAHGRSIPGRGGPRMGLSGVQQPDVA